VAQEMIDGTQLKFSTEAIVRELRLIRKGVTELLHRTDYVRPRGKVSKQPRRKYEPDDGFPGRE